MISVGGGCSGGAQDLCWARKSHVPQGVRRRRVDLIQRRDDRIRGGTRNAFQGNFIVISAVQRSGKRRQSRKPAGFLMVQVEEGGLDRVVTGQLVDTSKGGLGLALDSPLAEGSKVIVTRGAQAAEGEGAQRWERREGRVVYAAPPQDGVYRV